MPGHTNRTGLLVLALGTSIAAPSASARAQVERGDTIRLWGGRRELPRATYVRTDGSSLYQRPLAGGDTQQVASWEITRAEVLRGRRRAGLGSVGYGALIGGAAGFGAGIMASTATGSSQRSKEVSSAPAAVIAVTVLGAATGSVVGALAAFRHVDAWNAFDPARPGAVRPGDEWRRPMNVERLGTGGPLTPVGDSATGGATETAAPATEADTIEPSVAYPGSQHDAGVVAAGDTVRLFAGGSESVHGILVSADTAALEVMPMNGRRALRFGRTQVSGGDVRRGARRRGRSAFAKGTVSGVAVGVAIVTVALAAQNPRNEGMDVLAGFFLGGVSTVVGTVVGTGVAMTWTDRWIPFYPATLRTIDAR